MGAYRVSVNTPVGTEQTMMDSINDAMDPFYPGYDRCFCMWQVTGTWRPSKGSNPYLGKIGEVETAQEIRIEFAVHEKDLHRVIRAIRDAHPYEEPAIDVIPLIPWKDLAGPSDS